MVAKVVWQDKVDTRKLIQALIRVACFEQQRASLLELGLTITKGQTIPVCTKGAMGYHEWIQPKEQQGKSPLVTVQCIRCGYRLSEAV